MLTEYLKIKKLNVCPRGPYPQSTYICRVQSCVWRLPKYWPPTPPSPPKECVLPPHQRRGDTQYTRRAVGGGVNILDDARHWIGLLQYNHPTSKTHLVHTGFFLSSIVAVHKVLLNLCVRGRMFSQAFLYFTMMFFDNYSVKHNVF